MIAAIKEDAYSRRIPLLNQHVDTCQQRMSRLAEDGTARARCGRDAKYVVEYGSGIPCCKSHIAALLDFVHEEREVKVYSVAQWRALLAQEGQ